MKALGQLLVWASLAVGALAALTAYHAPLDSADERLIGETLYDPAGGEWEGEKIVPLAAKDTELDAETLADLRKNEVEIEDETRQVRYVRLKGFSWQRWQGRWIFLAAIGGMFLGALLTRRGAATAAAKEGELERRSPEELLQAISTELDSILRRAKETVPEQAREDLIVEEVGRLQRTLLTQFVDSREDLIAQRGLSGMAELMDAFSAAERQINRAWSTASDSDSEEALGCLETARELLPGS